MTMQAVPQSPATPALPESVRVPVGSPPRHTPNELRLLKQMTGKTLTELAGEGGDTADQEQVVIWMALRRLGFDPTYDEAGDVLIEWVEPEPDPTNGEPSPSSPPSAGSGP